MQILQIAITIIILIVIFLLLQFVLVPYIRLQIRRKASRDHRPQPEEIWVQDDGIIYIDAVGPTGVEIMTFDPNTHTFHKWKDTWADWERRVQMRTVYYTGQRRPLGNVV
jgi:hypothetical protein